MIFHLLIYITIYNVFLDKCCHPRPPVLAQGCEDLGLTKVVVQKELDRVLY